MREGVVCGTATGTGAVGDIGTEERSGGAMRECFFVFFFWQKFKRVLTNVSFLGLTWA